MVDDLPPEFAVFEEYVDSDSFIPLRQRVSNRQLLHTVLIRFTERMYFFPIGLQPNLKAPIDIICNGLMASAMHDYYIKVAGKKNRVAVVVFHFPKAPGDLVQARYENTPA